MIPVAVIYILLVVTVYSLHKNFSSMSNGQIYDAGAAVVNKFDSFGSILNVT